MIDYKARAEFWRKAAESNLDMLADAHRKIKQMEDIVNVYQQQTLHESAMMQAQTGIGGLGHQLGALSGLTHGRT